MYKRKTKYEIFGTTKSRTAVLWNSEISIIKITKVELFDFLLFKFISYFMFV